MYSQEQRKTLAVSVLQTLAELNCDQEGIQGVRISVVPRDQKGEQMSRKWYLIGDPAVRDKINATLRVAGMSIVLGFACIGFGTVLGAWVQILAW